MFIKNVCCKLNVFINGNTRKQVGIRFERFRSFVLGTDFYCSLPRNVIVKESTIHLSFFTFNVQIVTMTFLLSLYIFSALIYLDLFVRKTYINNTGNFQAFVFYKILFV